MGGEEGRSARVALCTQSGGSARSAYTREFCGGAAASADLHGDGFGGARLERDRADIRGPQRCKKGTQSPKVIPCSRMGGSARGSII
jgi:hypothetical protein